MSVFDKQQKQIDSVGFVDKEITSHKAEEYTAPVSGKDEYEWYNSQIYVPVDRRQRLGEYEEMNSYPEISSALDIYADDSTQMDDEHKRLKIITKNNDIKEELNRLFFETLSINGKLWEIVRGTCMYGDSFYEMILAKDRKSIVGMKLS
jgi:hypothetical protein